jgi:serine protease Do
MSPGQEEFFERFFGFRGGTPRGEQREQYRLGAGSGVIIDKSGIVLTNNHVVQDATLIRIKLNDGRSFDAEVLGRDPLTDLAVVKLKGTNGAQLPFAQLGDSATLRVGEWVVAIGNPFGLASSVSVGIISAKERNIGAGPYDEFLQTDAAINPGNSGGPLFTLNGEVVGINTAITGQGSGIGFAIPSNMARALLPQLEKSGKVTRGWLGVAVQDLSPELAKALHVPVSQGAVVADVNSDTPAASAGLKSDDVITAVDGRALESAGALTRNIALKAPGTTTKLTIYREGKQMELSVKLGTRPDLEGLAEQKPGGKEAERQQRLGLSFQDMDPSLAQSRNLPSAGALITDVVPGSAAERAGLGPGGVIIEAAGKPVRSASDLRRILLAAKAGTGVLLRVQTGGGRGLRVLTIPE